MRRSKRIAVVVAMALVVATVGVVGTAGARTSAQGAGAKCPLNALKKADKPVEITFWHSMPEENERTLQRLTEQFNSSQPDVRVELVNQTTYQDTLTKYVAGLSTGDLPDLVQMQETAVQQMIDTQSVLPVQACVEADDYDLSDHLERVVDYYTVEDTLWPMPFNVSNPVFLYNKTAFRQAGLDPDKPPTTLEEVKEASRTLKQSGAVREAGFGLKLDAGIFQQWLAKAGKPFVNNGNGRKARATEVVFDGKAGVEIFTWVSEMVEEDLAVTNNADTNPFDNLLGIGSGSHAMTVDTTATLGTVYSVLEGGQFPNVEAGVAPMPGPAGRGGVIVGGGALWIVAESSKAKQAAAWEYSKFLNEPESQAEWAAGTGYLPIRESAVELPVLQEAWGKRPGYRVAYEQLLAGVNNLATSGSVIGDYQGVRDAVVDAYEALVTQGKKPKAALKAAKKAADAKIEEYNARVGA